MNDLNSAYFVVLSLIAGFFSGLASSFIVSKYRQPEIEKTFLDQRKERTVYLFKKLKLLELGFYSFKDLHEKHLLRITSDPNYNNSRDPYNELSTDENIKLALSTIEDLYLQINKMLTPYDYGQFFVPSFIVMMQNYSASRMSCVRGVLNGEYKKRPDVYEKRSKKYADAIISYVSKPKYLKNTSLVKDFIEEWLIYKPSRPNVPNE